MKGTPMKALLAFGAYIRKSAVALVGAEIGWAATSLQHGFGHVTFAEWIGEAVIVATAFGVYLAPNEALPPVAVTPPKS